MLSVPFNLTSVRNPRCRGLWNAAPIENTSRRGGFTLLELFVAMTITILLLVLLQQVVSFASAQWRRTNDSAKAFQDARAAFDSITRTLAQATLMVSYDYYNAARISRSQIAAGPDSTNNLRAFVPAIYGRYSGLHFTSGKNLLAAQHTHGFFFQAPLDFQQVSSVTPSSGQLNATGYFVRYGSDAANRPPNVSTTSPAPRQRFRLMRYLQPTDKLDVYRDVNSTAWFKTEVDTGAHTHLVAENVVAFVVLPKLPDEPPVPLDSLAPDYEYDSRALWTTGTQPVQMHQLPPLVRILLVAIDETSASRNPDLGSAFQALFKDPKKFDDDLAVVEAELRSKRANYRVFQTEIPIRAAKWSE